MSCGIVAVTKILLQLNLALQPKSKDMLRKLMSLVKNEALKMFCFVLDKQNQNSNVSILNQKVTITFRFSLKYLHKVLPCSAVAKAQWNHMISEGAFLIVETISF